ncbi:F-box domain-containing protein [Madurella fahalii]|uniref:F-box domain-containing protein n=1 Tax=Madurella fahalii TaxID=1157608 RepID=A0ABQ0GKV2_9PEZI
MREREPCYLTSLPPELVDMLFSEMDSVRDLGNFITTCRFIYASFQGRKASIIFRVLQNELGAVVIDALFLQIFPYADPGDPGKWMTYWDGTHTATAVYRDMLNSGQDGRRDACPSLVELTDLCRALHNMNFLASVYIATQLRSFGTKGLVAALPSRTERLRVLRAFYRRQIVCNAWAPTRRTSHWMHRDTAAIGNTSDHGGVRLGLFAAFEPWELQQVDHADYFVVRLCMALWLVGEEAAAAAAAPGPANTVVEPLGETEFGDLMAHVDCLVRYMREHPGLADAALRTPPSLSRPRDEASIDRGPIPLYRQLALQYSLLCLRLSWQVQRLARFPDPARDQLGQQRQEGDAGHGRTVHFVGDAVHLPPFGWTDALDGRYAMKELDRLSMLRTGWVFC